jgi:hypothetical protein
VLKRAKGLEVLPVDAHLPEMLAGVRATPSAQRRSVCVLVIARRSPGMRR